MIRDRRQEILAAGLEILREHGLAGLTQPRVAAKVGLRQSHLTYYYPTRIDLLTAVAQLAIDTQLAAVKSALSSVSVAEDAAGRLARATSQHANTRVLASLNQAADQEPAVRAVFEQLTNGFVLELGELLGRLGLAADEARVDLLHALLVGLSIIELATGRPNAETRAKAVLELAFQMLAGDQK